MTGPRGPTEELLDLRVLEARHPVTVALEAGEHHSQDVRKRIHAHVDVTALLAHCRALRAALQEIGLMLAPDNAIWPTNDALVMAHVVAIRKGAAAALALARDEQPTHEAESSTE